MADLLSDWWVHPTTIQRLTGHGPDGDLFAAEEVGVLGFVEQKVRLVRNQSGDEVVSSATIYYPPGTPPIPGGSLITPPPLLGGAAARARVIACNILDAGPLETPNHVEVMVE